MVELALMNVYFHKSIDTEELIDTFPVRHPRRIKAPSEHLINSMVELALMNVYFHKSNDTEELIDTFPVRHPRRINVKNMLEDVKKLASYIIVHVHALLKLC